MMGKRVYKPKGVRHELQASAAVLDRFVTEVDVNMVLCGVAGGVAAYGGLVPPFTRLLMTFSQVSGANISINNNPLTMDYKTIAAFLSPGGMLGAGAGALFGGILKRQIESGGTSPELATIQADTIASSAVFMSGALEAMLMYKAFSSPELMKALISAPGEILKGVGSIVPG